MRPLARVVPVYRDTPPVEAVLPGLGFVAGTVLSRLAGTRADRLPGPRVLGPRRVADYVPGVRRDGLRFGHLNWDCQLVDDARLVTAVARTAAGHGARVVTRARAVGSAIGVWAIPSAPSPCWCRVRPTASALPSRPSSVAWTWSTDPSRCA